MNTVSPLQSIPLAGKISDQPARPQQPAAILETGNILKAVVIESRPDNRILLQIGENQLLARSEVALKTGQTLQLQLVSTSPQFELKIVSDSLQQLLGRTLTLAGNTINITDLFPLLQQQPGLFGGLSLQSRQTLESFFSLSQNDLSGKDSGAVLSQLLDRLGLSLENLLARGETATASSTLKAALLEILHNFTNDGKASELAGKALSTLEFFQLAQLHADSGQQLIFPLPFPFLEQGFLLIEKRRDEQGGSGRPGEKEEHRFSLHLKMTDIGSLRIDFFHTPEGLFIRFHADSQEKADFIAGFSQDLKDAISGGPILNLSFAADAEDPVAELVRHLVPEGKAVIDTTA